MIVLNPTGSKNSGHFDKQVGTLAEGHCEARSQDDGLVHGPAGQPATFKTLDFRLTGIGAGLRNCAWNDVDGVRFDLVLGHQVVPDTWRTRHESPRVGN